MLFTYRLSPFLHFIFKVQVVHGPEFLLQLHIFVYLVLHLMERERAETVLYGLFGCLELRMFSKIIFE